MDFHKFGQAGHSKIKLVGQSVAPTLWLLAGTKIFFEDPAYFRVVCGDKQIQIASRVRPVIQSFHYHDWVARFFENTCDLAEISKRCFDPSSFLQYELIQSLAGYFVSCVG